MAKHKTLLQQVAEFWYSTESITQLHIHGTKTLNFRLFALFLTNFITNELCVFSIVELTKK